MTSILRLEDVLKQHAQADGSRLVVLDGASLSVAPGETVSISGRSGSGKSTLLHVAAGIEVPTRGGVFLLERELGSLDDGERSRLRGRAVGMVFQFFHLMPWLTVRENVLLPARINGAGDEPPGEAADRLLAAVGLGDRAGEPCRTLSGGEMQRAAIARALILKPPLVLADEPTGNLDGAAAEAVSALLFDLAAEQGAGLVVATHDAELASRCSTRMRLSGGRIVPIDAPVGEPVGVS